MFFCNVQIIDDEIMRIIHESSVKTREIITKRIPEIEKLIIF